MSDRKPAAARQVTCGRACRLPPLYERRRSDASARATCARHRRAASIERLSPSEVRARREARSEVSQRDTFDHSRAVWVPSTLLDVAALDHHLVDSEQAQPDANIAFVRRVLEAARAEGEQNFTAIFREAVRRVELHPVARDAHRALAIAAMRSTEDEWRRAYFREPPAPKPLSNRNLPSPSSVADTRRFLDPPKPKPRRLCLQCCGEFAPDRANQKICSWACKRAREREQARARKHAQVPAACV